jgi:hypothetical protein
VGPGALARTTRPLAVAGWLVLSVVLASGAAPTASAPGPAAAASLAPAGLPSDAHPQALTLTWTNLSLTSAQQPPPRNDGNTAWDAGDGYSLLFGGVYPNETLLRDVLYNDTWSFLGGKWTNQSAAGPRPSERQGAGLVYDPASNEVVLFGGATYFDHLENDTWTYSDGVWTNITSEITGASPPPSLWFSMAYDPAISAVLLFGGSNYTSGEDHDYGNDTWEFSGHTWTHLTPSVLPPGRYAQEMVWDAADNEMVMFGGMGPSTVYNDTWTYSDGDWSPVTVSVHPSPHSGYGLAYDSAAGKVVLYGGNSEGSDFYSTWLFSGGAWTQYNTTVYPTNPQSTYGQLDYDVTDNEVVDLNEPVGMGAVSTWALTISSSTVTPTNYPITFQETGLPSSTSWGVSLEGSVNSSTTSTVGFTDPNGTYSFYLPPVTGYTATPSSGSVNVSGKPVVEEITFTAGAAPLSVRLVPMPATIVLGNTTNLSAITTGGTPPIRYNYTVLPPGCKSNSLDAVLPCTPNATGTFHLTVAVEDDLNHFAEANATLNVTSPTTTSPPPSSGSGNSWWWIILIVVVVAVVVALAVLLRRRRPPPAPAPTPGNVPPPMPPPPGSPPAPPPP